MNYTRFMYLYVVFFSVYIPLSNYIQQKESPDYLYMSDIHQVSLPAWSSAGSTPSVCCDV